MASSLPEPPDSVDDDDAPGFWGLMNFAAGAAQFYHGYKRNGDSVAWGLLWSVSGLPPAILGYCLGFDSDEAIFLSSHVPPLGLAAKQGFAEPLPTTKE